MSAAQKLEFSIHPNPAPVAADVRAGLLKDPGFGRVFTDHMVTIRWTQGGGWQDAQLRAREAISLDPAAAVLHYGQEIFEGLKAYRRDDGSIALFRPEQNARRFNASAARMAMPEVPEELFLGAIDELVKADLAWVPTGDGSLYLRPFLFAERGLPRRAAVLRISVRADRQLGRLLFQGRREAGDRLAVGPVHARRRRRHGRGQVRRQLRGEPAGAGRGDRARLRPGRVPRRRRTSLGRGTRRHERHVRVRRRLPADAAAERHDPAGHHARFDSRAGAPQGPRRARGALLDGAVARGRRRAASCANASPAARPRWSRRSARSRAPRAIS